jgi:tetratricopeptide (TPR) repeat protein
MTETFEATVHQAMERGLALQREGQLGCRRRESTSRSWRTSPEYADAWHFRGLVALSRGQRDEALVFIGKAIEAAPDYAAAYNNLGNVYFLMNPAPRGAGGLAAGRGERPGPGRGPLQPGRGLRGHRPGRPGPGRLPQGAGGAPEKVRRLPPHGLAALRRHRIEEAAQVFREWLAVEPDNDYARHMLASCTQEDIPLRASTAPSAGCSTASPRTSTSSCTGCSTRRPALVAEGLKRVLGAPAGTLDVLDAGCGTGCAPRG